MADIPLSKLIGGGSSFKVETVGIQRVALSGITNQDILTVTPPDGKTVRLTALAVMSSTSSLTNVSVKFGSRVIVNNADIEAAFSTSNSFRYSIGGSANSASRCIEGKVGESLVVSKGATNQSDTISIAYEIGGYEE